MNPSAAFLTGILLGSIGNSSQDDWMRNPYQREIDELKMKDWRLKSDMYFARLLASKV